MGGEQTHTTSVIKKTLNPYWNEMFDLYVHVPSLYYLFCVEGRMLNTYNSLFYRKVNEDSILAIQIFDQKKFKKKDQGFLGVINVRVGDVIDLDVGEDGEFHGSPATRAAPSQRHKVLIAVCPHRDAYPRSKKIQR